MRWLVALGLLAVPALAEGERVGVFDYYVLSLSWSPSYCALEGFARDDGQCEAVAGHGFTLHGLWPQHETGWPSHCRTSARDPTRDETAAMADIMGSAGLAWHQWKKHGRCSGLLADDYFDAARAAYGEVALPEVLTALGRDVRLPASVVEAAFLETNPGFGPGMITVTCKSGMIREARICLTLELRPRDCAPDVALDCTLENALLPAMR